MTEEKEMKPCHSPLPWRVAGIADIEDANGTPCACGWNPDSDYGQEGQERAKADAALIVKAVNERERLLKLVSRLLNAVDALLEAVDEGDYDDLRADARDALKEAGYGE